MTTFKYPLDISQRTHLDISAFRYRLPTIPERNEIGLNSLAITTTTDKAESTRADLNEAQGKVNSPTNASRVGPSIFTAKLFIPGGFGETLGANWDDETVAFIGDAKNVLSNIASGDLARTLGSAGEILRGAGQVGLLTAITNIAGKLGGVGNIAKASLEASAGRVISPNQAKVFKGSAGRSLDLSFLMSPRNSKEGDQMISIIDRFRENVLPELEDVSSKVAAATPFKETLSPFNGLLFTYKYPPLFDIRVIEGPDQPVRTGTFFEFKAMALTGFSVEYSTNTLVFAYYNDGVPDNARLNLSFQSIFPAFTTGPIARNETAGTSPEEEFVL